MTPGAIASELPKHPEIQRTAITSSSIGIQVCLGKNKASKTPVVMTAITSMLIKLADGYLGSSGRKSSSH
jgi:hypothetical protein